MLAKQVLSMSFQNAGFGLLCLFVNRLWWRSNIDWSIAPAMSGAKIKLISLLAGDDAGVLFIPFQTVRFRKSLLSEPLQRNTQKFDALSVCNGADRICKLARQRLLSWPES
ncbi:MAG: hypothetical protein DMG97_38360 [Acidobacteria bacterium]|nr:MAG: hypothetical protein DMG97_38360 [Acidobacteriota bacterium]